MGPDSLSCPTQGISCMPTARQAAVFDPAELMRPSLKPWGRNPQGWLCHQQPGAVGLALPESPLTALQKGPRSAFGTASEQHQLTLQACILNQFRSNTKEIPNQRAFYFLCFPCNPPDCLPVPGSAAGLKTSSLFPHAGELLLFALP